MNNNNSLSEQLGGLLRSKGLLMGTAESCTGGRIANMVTLVVPIILSGALFLIATR